MFAFVFDIINGAYQMEEHKNNFYENENEKYKQKVLCWEYSFLYGKGQSSICVLFLLILMNFHAIGNFLL